MLSGAAGTLVGAGSAYPSAIALARRYISLLVAPTASMAVATTAQFRTSVVMEDENFSSAETVATLVWSL